MMPSNRLSIDSEDSLRALETAEGPDVSLRPPRVRGRSSTLSTFGGFEFRPDLLPLTLSEVEPDGDAPMEKTVGLVNGVALVVGIQVGSGIFSSPGVVLAETRSVGAALLVWVVSGVLAWTGASSFAELGSMIPLSGGPQAYLAYAYNPLVSFLYSWTAISALKPGSGAIIALIFGEYVMRLFYPVGYNPLDIPAWQTKLMACASVLVAFVLCVGSPKLGPRAAVFLTFIKMSALIAVTVLGLIQLIRGKASSALREPIFAGTSPNPSSYALALYSGLWAFDGWDATNFITGEMKNVETMLPRVIHSSMSIVLALFLSANLSYFVVLDKTTVASSNTVALDFGRALFGSIGGLIFSATVAVSCLGALQGGLFTSARLVFASGQEGFLPSFFGQLNSRLKTPLNATALHAALTIVFIVVGGGFRSLINFYSVAGWGFYFLTVCSLLVLRVKEPNLDRPYKTWLVTPLVFSGVALFLLFMPIVAAPLEALAAFGFILAGVPIYYVTRRRSAGKDHGIGAVFGQIISFGRGGYVRAAAEENEERVEMLQRR